MTTDTTDIETLLDQWQEAERGGRADQLGHLLTDDFVGIGPVGFMLPRAEWVGRLGPDLRYDELALDDVSSRSYGDATLVVAHQHARGEARGNPVPPDTRVSFLVVANDDGPKIAGIQYSFMAPS
jgi:ketosteroid isomerase-like protein